MIILLSIKAKKIIAIKVYAYVNVTLNLYVNLIVHLEKEHYILKYNGLYNNCLRSINWSEVFKYLQILKIKKRARGARFYDCCLCRKLTSFCCLVLQFLLSKLQDLGCEHLRPHCQRQPLLAYLLLQIRR